MSNKLINEWMKYKELSDELNKQFMKEKKTLKKEKIKKGEGTF